MDGYEASRQRHLQDLLRLLPEHVQGLRWSAERLRRERAGRLRALLHVAQARSPWHRARLAGIDPDQVREEDLAHLPPMTWDDLMSHWDEIVTGPRHTLARVERHLAGRTSDAYLFGEFRVVASAGSTGRRSVFAYGWQAWLDAYAVFVRQRVWDRVVSPELTALPHTVAVVASQRVSDMTSALAHTFATPELQVASFAVTQPLAQLVASLNRLQPGSLLGHPSVLSLLAEQARHGRLRISPRRITASSEPLLPEVRQSVEAAFEAQVAGVWAASEAGPLAVGCWRIPGLHLCEDLVIIEPVDALGRPVPAEVRSDKVYVTALLNPLLPLIRFEMTCQVKLLEDACPCGSAHRRIADVGGHVEDVFAYPSEVVVHSLASKSVPGRAPTIVECQLPPRATLRGEPVGAAGRARADLFAAIAHELRLPLSHIKGFVSSLRRTDVQWDEATRSDFLAEIDVETDRLTELVDELMQSGVGTDKGSERVGRVLTSPEALIDGGLHRVRGLLGQRAVRLDVAGPLPRVIVDPGGIERVLANLLENAAKYSPPQSTIWISARVVAGCTLELSVQDAGPGIRPQDRQRIFEPFFRARISQQRNVPGHGLGLAVCKSIVAAHGGDIRVDEHPGGGASFTVVLPVRVCQRHLGRGDGMEEWGYEPPNGSGCGRRIAHAPAHLEQSQGEWIRRAHRRRRGGGAQADRGVPIGPAAA